MSYNIKNALPNFKATEEWLTNEYASIQTGRATPLVLDGVVVESYGSMQPLRNLASISIEDPKTLCIAPWDKNSVKSIEKALTDSNLGLGVVADSDGVRLTFPALTTERRQQTVKILGSLQEDARIRVRKTREDEIKEVEKLSKDGMSEDDKRRFLADIQKIVDETNRNLEAIFKKKELEVLGQ
jgi:ribosome recycling factor